MSAHFAVQEDHETSGEAPPVNKRRGFTSRRPFQQLTNTPSKQKSIGGSVKPVKSLIRSLSAPVLSPAFQEQPSSISQSVFRAREVPGEMEDMWSLKRATPITEEDDEDEMESPTKRSRTTFFAPITDTMLEQADSSESAQILKWNTQVSESNDSGFELSIH